MSAPSPFALLLPSRPVYVSPATLSPTQYAFSVPAFPYFSHIVVFLLPGMTLPPGTLAGVYIQFPSSSPEFKFLGAIGHDKQSAIFRVGGVQAAELNGQLRGSNIDQDEMTDIDTPVLDDSSGSAPDVTVGVSIEPVASIQVQLDKLKSSGATTNSASTALVLAKQRQSSPVSTELLAQRIIKNAFNFLASFAGSTAPGGEEVVPLRSFKAWWEKFERRVENDPTFLERDGDG